ncbi:MAG: ABC transporter ATP-binding protein [archaeon]
MPEPIFKIKGVTKVFGHKTVLKDMSLEVFHGEILGIIGASGSGKTTLLNTIIGFLRPEQGDITFRQEHLLDFKKSAVFRSVYDKPEDVKRIYGFAAQTPSFYDTLTVKENLIYFGSLYDLSKDAIATNVETLLNLMGLKSSETLLGRNLSGGMERRLDIACSLIHDPRVLILDEPTADLDPVLRNHIWELIKKVNKKGTTIIIASHHLNEIETLCDRIAVLKDSKILDIGSPDKVKMRFTKKQEIQVQCYPGNYEKIIAGLRHKKIYEAEIRGVELVIHTKTTKKVLQELLRLLDTLKENLVDIRVSKPSLDDIFILMSEKNETGKDNK